MERLHVLKISLLVLLALGVRSLAPAQRSVATRGEEILGPDGTPLLLRGINLGNWLVPEGYMFKFDSATSPRMINQVLCELIGPEEAASFWEQFRENYINREDIQLIKSLGLNCVRVPFNWRLFLPERSADRWLLTGFRLLDRLVGWCREAGIFVILDMHCAPGGQTGDNIDDSWGYPFLFDSPGEQARTIELWRRIAHRYRNEPILVGYDLLNEPIPPFFDIERLNPLLEPLYKRIVSAIREVDTTHLVFLGGAQWNTNFAVFGPPFDAKVVYTFHRYWCDTTQATLREYLEFRSKYNVPLWLGESGENGDAWIDSFRRLLERNAIGWCFWPFKKMDSRTCVVTFPRPAGWSLLQSYADGPRSGYASIRAHHPPGDLVRAALQELVEACRLSGCRINAGYVEALGCSLPH